LNIVHKSTAIKRVKKLSTESVDNFVEKAGEKEKAKSY